MSVVIQREYKCVVGRACFDDDTKSVFAPNKPRILRHTTMCIRRMTRHERLFPPWRRLPRCYGSTTVTVLLAEGMAPLS